jgi:hypothetical protein
LLRSLDHRPSVVKLRQATSDSDNQNNHPCCLRRSLFNRLVIETAVVSPWYSDYPNNSLTIQTRSTRESWYVYISSKSVAHLFAGAAIVTPPFLSFQDLSSLCTYLHIYRSIGNFMNWDNLMSSCLHSSPFLPFHHPISSFPSPHRIFTQSWRNLVHIRA